jgi:hypothetical protein
MKIEKIEKLLKAMPKHRIEVGYSSWGDVTPRYEEFVTIEEVINYLKENEKE